MFIVRRISYRVQWNLPYESGRWKLALRFFHRVRATCCAYLFRVAFLANQELMLIHIDSTLFIAGTVSLSFLILTALPDLIL